jgi:15-cis-phytoene synthase
VLPLAKTLLRPLLYSQPMDAKLARSYQFCETLARSKARNFYPAFRLLPKPQRQAMCAMYAFMRVADDLADEAGELGSKQAALSGWRRDFAHALEGKYAHPLHPALHHALARYSVPPEYLFAVMDGVEMDLFHKTYATFDDLYKYCYRVASAVGLVCIHVWGFHGAEATKYAEKAGIAFQLTNILRDLREDNERGRIYLPQEDLSRFHYTADELRRGQRGENFRALMEFQVKRARDYYVASEPLDRLLEPAGRGVFRVLSRTYRGLLDAIEKRDYDVFSARVRVSRWRKLQLVAQALPARWGWA